MGNPALEPFVIQDVTFPPLGELAYMPVTPTDFLGMSSPERFEIVGESRFADRIRAVLAARDADTDPGTELYAMLIAEPLNTFDRNAVRVDLLWNETVGTCGYLSREQARQMSPVVRAQADQGRIVAMLAYAFGGTEDKPNYGVWIGGR